MNDPTQGYLWEEERSPDGKVIRRRIISFQGNPITDEHAQTRRYRRSPAQQEKQKLRDRERKLKLREREAVTNYINELKGRKNGQDETQKKENLENVPEESKDAQRIGQLAVGAQYRAK